MLIIRAVTILLTLVLGVLQTAGAGAETASSYDFAASYETLRPDKLVGGSASTDGSASAASGELDASASVSSSRPIGFSGGIGENFAKRDSFVRQTFTSLQAGDYVVTVNVAVSSLDTPQSSTPGVIDAVTGFLNPVGLHQLSSSRSYSFVQVGASAVDVDADHSSPMATFKTWDGTDRSNLTTGTNTFTVFGVRLSSPGSVIVEVHLTSEAWARGDNASASAAGIADVTSIRIS